MRGWAGGLARARDAASKWAAAAAALARRWWTVWHRCDAYSAFLALLLLFVICLLVTCIVLLSLVLTAVRLDGTLRDGGRALPPMRSLSMGSFLSSGVAHVDSVLKRIAGALGSPVDPTPPWGRRRQQLASRNQSSWRPRDCEPQCEDNGGQCDTERGLCICPWGRTGPSCGQLRLTSCRLAPVASEGKEQQQQAAEVPHCGDGSLPRPCSCADQCRGEGGDYAELAAAAGYYGVFASPAGATVKFLVDDKLSRGSGPCFVLRRGPDSAVARETSLDVPDGNEPGVVFYRRYDDYRQARDWAAGAAEPLPAAALLSREAALLTKGDSYFVPKGLMLLPLAKCPNKCSLRGRCFGEPVYEAPQATPSSDAPSAAAAAVPTANVNVLREPASGHCLCYYGSAGSDCAEEWSACINACSGRGRCVQGVCRCERGAWGIDCSRGRTPRLAEGHGRLLPPGAPEALRPLAIYVYGAAAICMDEICP